MIDYINFILRRTTFDEDCTPEQVKAEESLDLINVSALIYNEYAELNLLSEKDFRMLNSTILGACTENKYCHCLAIFGGRK